MVKLKVSGITCGGCVSAIRRAVGEVAEDAKVDVDIAKGEVSIKGAPDRAAIVRVIEEAGYDVIGDAA